MSPSSSNIVVTSALIPPNIFDLKSINPFGDIPSKCQINQYNDAQRASRGDTTYQKPLALQDHGDKQSKALYESAHSQNSKKGSQ